MGLTLEKGGSVSLTKGRNLTKVLIGLGWDVSGQAGVEFDLDASALALGKDGKALGQDGLAFYNQKSVLGGAIACGADNRTGEGDGDDETITIDLAAVPAEVDQIAVLVTIHQAEERKQSFGQVQRASIRAVDTATNEELAVYNLTDSAGAHTAITLGTLARGEGGWDFKAVGQPAEGGFKGILASYGLNL